MHFAEFLNEGFPAHLRILSPPTCVGFGTGGRLLVRSFSWQFSAAEFSRAVALPIYRFSAFPVWGFASIPAYRLRRALPFARSSSLLCHSILKQLRVVLDFLPVVLRLRSLPRLRSRLTLSRRSLLRNPRAFGGKDSHLSFRYSYRHSHFLFVHMSFRSCFFLIRTLPYP